MEMKDKAVKSNDIPLGGTTVGAITGLFQFVDVSRLLKEISLGVIIGHFEPPLHT